MYISKANFHVGMDACNDASLRKVKKGEVIKADRFNSGAIAHLLKENLIEEDKPKPAPKPKAKAKAKAMSETEAGV